jgi:hypothetical protein
MILEEAAIRGLVKPPPESEGYEQPWASMEKYRQYPNAKN